MHFFLFFIYALFLFRVESICLEKNASDLQNVFDRRQILESYIFCGRYLAWLANLKETRDYLMRSNDVISQRIYERLKLGAYALGEEKCEAWRPKIFVYKENHENLWFPLWTYKKKD